MIAKRKGNCITLQYNSLARNIDLNRRREIGKVTELMEVKPARLRFDLAYSYSLRRALTGSTSVARRAGR